MRLFTDKPSYKRPNLLFLFYFICVLANELSLFSRRSFIPFNSNHYQFSWILLMTTQLIGNTVEASYVAHTASSWNPAYARHMKEF